MSRRTPAIIAVISLLSIVPITWAGDYVFSDLGTPGAATSSATGINSRGQVCGWEGTFPFLWTPGASDGNPANPQMKDLGTLGGGVGKAFGLNNAGQVVGYAQLSSNVLQPFVWTPGAVDGVPSNPQMKGLGLSTGFISNPRATGINNLGQIAGYSSAMQSGYAFLHLSAAAYGLPAGCNNLGGLSSPTPDTWGYGLNDAGQVVGRTNKLQPTGSHQTAFLWTPGGTDGAPANPQMKDLGGLVTNYSSTAYAINNQGKVAGGAYADDQREHPFLWSAGGTDGAAVNPEMKDLGLLAGSFKGSASALNSLGLVVGSCFGSTDWQHGFIWLPEEWNGLSAGMHDLNDFLPAGSGWTIQSASGINDAGWIVGTAIREADGVSRAFLMRPVPEPAGLLLLAVGGMGLLRARRAAKGTR